MRREGWPGGWKYANGVFGKVSVNVNKGNRSGGKGESGAGGVGAGNGGAVGEGQAGWGARRSCGRGRAGALLIMVGPLL